MRAMLAVPVLMALVGCSQIAKLSDDDLAHDINIGANKAAIYGMKALAKQFPDKKAAALKDIAVANDIIKKNILPVFNGAATAELAKSAVDTALSQLKVSLSPQVADALDLVFQILSTDIELPKNPADKLSDRNKKSVNAFFSGLSSGFDTVLSQG